MVRQLGDRAAEDDSSEISLRPFTDPEREVGRTKDNRAQPRYEVRDLTVHSQVGAKIVDVGSSGMGLETTEILPLEGQDMFEIVARSGRLRIPGRIAWCRLVRTVTIILQVLGNRSTVLPPREPHSFGKNF